MNKNNTANMTASGVFTDRWCGLFCCAKIMFNTFKFRHIQDTWKRPIHVSPNNMNSKTIIPSLTADFQGKIKNQFHLEVNGQNMVSRFPLIDNVGVYINVCSRERYRLPFVVKNILDALSGSKLAYNDDNKVISIYAQHALRCSNATEIAVFSETRFYHGNIFSIENAFVKLFVEAIPNDDIIQNPRTITHKLMQNPNNTSYIGMLVQEMKQQEVMFLTESDLSVYIDIRTSNSLGDIDNYVLPYLIAMEGLVYPDMRDISLMHLNLHRECTGRDYVKVEVYDMDN